MSAINYKATPTMARFHASDVYFRVVFGAVGTGKTVAAGPIEILRRACGQAPDEHGVRHTRFVVGRRSYPQLKDTVMATARDWTPPGLGTWRESPSLDWTARFSLPDGTTVNTEVRYRAFHDAITATEALKGSEYTGVYLSECAEMEKGIINAIRGRLRYPKNATWTGIWGESNPPNTTSWWHDTFEKEKPEGHEVFRQPPPLFYDPQLGAYNERKAYRPNPLAENIENLDKGYDYYFDQIPGNDWDYIHVYVLGNYGALFKGRAIYPEFQRYRHVALNTIPLEPGRLVVAGMDFGRNPAFVPTQMFSTGAVATLAEAVAFDIGLEEFIDTRILPLIRSPRFAGCPLLIVGDPSADRKESVSQYNAFHMLQQRGFAIQQAYTNDPTMRHDAVRHYLTRIGAAYYDPSCEWLIEGFEGAYHYKEQKSRQNIFRADKGDWSHVHDAEQYAKLYHYRGSVLDQPDRNRKPTPRKKYLYA